VSDGTSSYTVTNDVNLLSSVSVSDAGNLDLAGSLYGSRGLTKLGSGTLTLGVVGFSGSINVTAGTLVMFMDAGNNVTNSATFIYNGATTHSQITNIGIVLFSGATTTVAGNLTNNASGLINRRLRDNIFARRNEGKIVKEKFPNLDDEDQEAVRQHAVAALNVVQQAKKALVEGGEAQNTLFVDGVRRFALSVTELDIDLIDRINPFSEAYAILAKSMSEERLKQVAEVIAARKVSMTLDEARDLAKRALKFKEERGRLPSLTAPDPWEKRMAEGIAYLQRKAKEDGNG
jgi:autotransporter-associated beta strand protein